MDWIELTDMRFDAIVGVLIGEQAVAQPLVVDVKIHLALDGAGATGDLAKSVNYAAVASQVQFIAQQGRWRLIESLGTAVCRLLLAPAAAQEQRAVIERMELRIAKPTILDGLATPAVVFRRKREWVRLAKTTHKPRTFVEALEATPLSAAYRVHVEPGTTWDPPAGVALEVVAGRPRVAGRTLHPGDRLARCAKTVENHQKQAVTLLAVGSPMTP